ncbi:TPA: hypothetical protein R5R88_002232 [Salmonella enterica]|nr:hypothetical protein [Salmonella enterica]
MKVFFTRLCHGSFLALCIFPAHADITPLTSADEQQIRELIFRWNDALNKTEDAQPQSLYSAQVIWYGQPLSAQKVLANEQAFLAKNDDYRQRIVSTLNIQPIEQAEGQVSVQFVKRAGISKEKELNYPQELWVAKDSQGWRIVSETDGITRANQSKQKSLAVARGKFDGQHQSYVWMSDADPRTGDACLPDTDCDCSLWSSDPAVQPVNIPQCLANTVETLSGLDDSGRDRAVVSPEWWSSNSRRVYVYDIQQSQWIQVLPVIGKELNIQEAVTAKDIVQRDPQHPGQVNVTEAVWDDANEVMKTAISTQKLRVLK